MLRALLNVARHFAHEAKTHHLRSPHWRAFRKAWLKKHPTCAACGGRLLVEPHHVEPFEHNRARELDESNLLTLCMVKACHLRVGHGGNWRFYVERVRSLAALLLADPSKQAQVEEIAESERVPIRTSG